MIKLDTSEIDNILNEFLEQFDLKAYAGTDFAYYWTSDSIEYSLVVSERMNRLFMENAVKLGLKYSIDIFLLSLLHEIGHSQTFELLEDEVYIYCQDVKDSLDASKDEDVIKYLNLDDEWEATMWAIDYINHHFEEIKKLWGKLRPAIMKFYKENEII